MGPTTCRYCGWSDYSTGACEHCGQQKFDSNIRVIGCQQCGGYGWVGHKNPSTKCGSCGGRGFFYFNEPIISNGYGAIPVYSMGTTQPKKDGDEMFGVINFRFDGAVAPAMTVKPTQEEAQLYAEQLAASYRGNIQTKNFFTVTVVNLRTGALIGSVSDAPPAITWGNSSSS